MKPLRGLTKVPKGELVSLLRAVHRGTLSAPFTRADLLAAGMNRIADNADALIGLDHRAVCVAITLVLAERRS